MDRSQIRTEVRDILGEDSADFWKDAELNRYITEALYRFAAEERWPWYVTEFTGQLDAGDPDLELTVDVAAARHMNLVCNLQNETRTWQPQRVSAAEGFALRSQYSGSTSSYPGWYYVTAVQTDMTDDEFVYVARFIPTPTDIIDVEGQYYRTPAALDGDADVPELPTRYHKALVHHAAATAWLKELNGGAKAQEQMVMYANVLGQAREQEMQAEPDDTPLVAGGDYSTFTYNAGPAWTVRVAETLGP